MLDKCEKSHYKVNFVLNDYPYSLVPPYTFPTIVENPVGLLVQTEKQTMLFAELRIKIKRKSELEFPLSAIIVPMCLY